MRLRRAILNHAEADPRFARELRRHLLAARALDLMHYGLDGLMEGRPVMLYHGTTRSFRTFDLSKSRDELVNAFYGKGIFLSPSKRVAEKYANANRNVGFDPSIIDDLKRVNAHAAEFLLALFERGRDAWEFFWKDKGFFREDPPPGEGQLDSEGFESYLGVDPNDLLDVAQYIIGSQEKPLGDGGLVNIFNMSTGAPGWLYDTLDKIGLNSEEYRPKVYTVMVTVTNPIVTARKDQARKARQKGYDCVIYHGTDLVGGVPEVAVFDPKKVHILRAEVV